MFSTNTDWERTKFKRPGVFLSRRGFVFLGLFAVVIALWVAWARYHIGDGNFGRRKDLAEKHYQQALQLSQSNHLEDALEHVNLAVILSKSNVKMIELQQKLRQAVPRP